MAPKNGGQLTQCGSQRYAKRLFQILQIINSSINLLHFLHTIFYYNINNNNNNNNNLLHFLHINVVLIIKPLCYEVNWRKRRILEALHIETLKPPANRKNGCNLKC